MKIPQVKPPWATGIATGRGIAKPKKTTAETIADMLDDDGQCYYTPDRRYLADLVGEHHGRVTAARDGGRVIRYQFEDGSAIVDAEGGWDLGFVGAEYEDCTCWPEATYGQHGPDCPHEEEETP